MRGYWKSSVVGSGTFVSARLIVKLDIVVDRLISYLDRLENEHVGNMDQYRVTREVPLPYSIEDAGRYSDDDDDDDSQSRKSSKSLRWRRRRGQSSSTVASPERAS